MSRFKNYLNEMSTTDALSLFGMNLNDITPEKLKKKFRELSKLHHPDKGGNDYDQKRINDAYDTLKQLLKTPGSNITKGFDWDSVDKKYQHLAVIVKTYLYEKLNPNNFIKHFSDITGKQITFKMTKMFPDENAKSPYGAGFECEFFDKNKDIVFTIHAYVDLISMSGQKTLGGGEQYSFSIMTESYTFAHNKKHRIGKKTFKNVSDHTFLSDPEKLFPTSKLKKIVAGNKKRKFSRKDMILFLEKRMNAKNINGNEFHIPLSNDIMILLFRSTMMRQGLWNIHNNIYINRKKVEKFKTYFTFEESEETANKFLALYKDLIKYNDPGKVANKIEKFLQQEKQLRK